MADGVRYLLENPPQARIHNVYYWYYATQVLHNYGGRPWDTWNRALRKLLVSTQIRSETCTTEAGTRTSPPRANGPRRAAG